MNGFIRHLDVECIPVGIGENRYSADTQAFGGLENAAGDFTAVGNEYFLKHRRFLLKS
jgi:hypothetical protein